MFDKYEKFALALTSLEIIGGIVIGTLCYGDYKYRKGETEARKKMQHRIKEQKCASNTED